MEETQTVHLSPTHKRMLDILKDGAGHTRDELHACLYDEQGIGKNVHSHLTELRRRLKRRGEDVICELGTDRVFRYRLVRTLGNPYRG